MTREIQGVLPVIHTPFDEQERIDHDSLAREVDFAFDSGADGIVLALASEILRLTNRERLELTRRLVELAGGRGPVIIGVHAESTAQSLEYAEAAQQAGADAVMATPPLTGGWTLDALFRHYAALVERTNLAVIVQDGSAHVGRPMPIAFQARLRNELGPRVLFKPEAVPVGPQFSQLRDATGGQARIFEGMGGMYLVDSFRRGVAGTIPGTDYVDAIAAVWRALKAGDEERVYRLHPLVCVLTALAGATLDNLVAVEKYILRRRGVIRTEVRRSPNSYTLDEETRQEVDRVLTRLLAELGKAE
jgi:4-hydroxy-tetrahydrodipicolinate synthase